MITFFIQIMITMLCYIILGFIVYVLIFGYKDLKDDKKKDEEDIVSLVILWPLTVLLFVIDYIANKLKK